MRPESVALPAKTDDDWERRTPPWAYWPAVILLLMFGTLAVLTIGTPFLVLGMALAVLRATRASRRVFWTVIASIGSFFVAYIAVSPLWCTSSATPSGLGIGPTHCSNLIGIDYSGTGHYNPAHWPAAVTGLATATLVGTGTFVVLGRHGRPYRSAGKVMQ